MDAILQKAWEVAQVHGPKILIALVIFVVGRWIAKGFKKLINRVLEKRNVDLTLVKFVGWRDFNLTEKIKKRFDEAGINIPFPQRDIHVYENKE